MVLSSLSGGDRLKIMAGFRGDSDRPKADATELTDSDAQARLVLDDPFSHLHLASAPAPPP